MGNNVLLVDDHDMVFRKKIERGRIVRAGKQRQRSGFHDAASAWLTLARSCPSLAPVPDDKTFGTFLADKFQAVVRLPCEFRQEDCGSRSHSAIALASIAPCDLLNGRLRGYRPFR